MKFNLTACALALVWASPSLAQASDAETKAAIAKYEALPWVEKGKTEVTPRASINLSPGVRYLDSSGTSGLLELTGNLPEPNSYTLASKANGWFAIYNFLDLGYVKDDEAIDADALLKDIREGQESANEDRKAKGLDPLTVVGWAVPPHYDPTTHNLEYGLTLGSPTGQNVNYHMRMLGRRGVMDAALITSPETLQADLAEFRKANAGFAFAPDERYAAFKDGDKVSEYGLAALIGGGAAAVAAKKGLLAGLLLLLAKFGKLIAVAGVAIAAAFAKLFRRGQQE